MHNRKAKPITIRLFRFGSRLLDVRQSGGIHPLSVIAHQDMAAATIARHDNANGLGVGMAKRVGDQIAGRPDQRERGNLCGTVRTLDTQCDTGFLGLSCKHVFDRASDQVEGIGLRGFLSVC